MAPLPAARIRAAGRPAESFAAGAVAVALLCLPALWNGFPIVFDDVGGYLARWPTRTLGLGRSVPYGLLLSIAASSWWIPVILVQAIVTTWIVDRALELFGLSRSPWAVAGVVAAIAATSGVAFFVSQVIPDAWVAPAVLALHLLAWHADRLTTIERTAMAAIVAFAGASHMAILGVLAGLWLLDTAAWLVRRWLRVAPTGLTLATAATGSAIVLLLAANLFVAGRFALTPGGEVFLFSRLVESGLVGQVLAEECPRHDWRLCAFQHDLPMIADDLLWGANSPLHKIGGSDDPRAKREIASIIARSIISHPLAHLKNAGALTAEQFLTVGTANNMSPVFSSHLRRTLELHAPWLVAPYDGSRQQAGNIDLGRWSDWIVRPITIIGCFALPFAALFLWRRDHRREALLPAMVFLALLGNALICGAVSGPNDRYQARLAWLAPLAGALAVLGGRQGVRQK